MSQLHFEQSDVEQVWIGDSGEPGPTVAILGGIHGDETAGVHIIDSLQKTLAVDCGRVILALGNPLAVHRGVRYVDQDLNRSFRPLTDIEATVEPSRRSREVQRAQNLMPLLALANGGTYDMHEQHRDGPTLIITEPSGFRTARAIGADVISSGWSTTEPGGTDSFANNQGFIGICHELGNLNNPEPNQIIGFTGIKRFLGSQGLIELNLEPLVVAPRFVHAYYTHIRESVNFSLAAAFASFEPLELGQLVATDGAKKIVAGPHNEIIFPHQNPIIGTSAFTLGQVLSD